MLTRRFALGMMLAAPAVAQPGFPTRSISLVVPFTPGGITDTSARLVAQPMGAFLGQSVVVENRPGAGGAIGTEAVARAAPDGYTILYGTQGTMATNPVLYKNLRYDAAREFLPVHGLTTSPLLLVANPQRSYTTLAALVAEAKRRPGELTFATSGIGTGTHMAAELFNQKLGTKIVIAPYQGGSNQAVTDLLAGRITLMFNVAATLAPHVQAGSLKALAVAQPKRATIMPNVPTLTEAGTTGYDAGIWIGLLAPAKTPPAIIQKLADAANEGLKSEQVQTALKSQGTDPLGSTPKEFADFINADIEKWVTALTAAGLRK